MTRDIPRRRELTLDELSAGVRDRDTTILPRALTLIESNNPVHQRQAEELLTRLARKTRESLLVCEAAGYDVVLVETVGVGQSETMGADMTDCFLALMLPGAGDDLQGLKRGLLKFVDVIAVNKADGDTLLAAQVAARQYESAFRSLLGRRPNPPAVLTCSALHNEHVESVWEAVERRYAEIKASGELADRHRRQGVRWLWAIIEDRLRQAVREHPNVHAIRDELEKQVLAGITPPEVAARKILDAFGLAEHGRER